MRQAWARTFDERLGRGNSFFCHNQLRLMQRSWASNFCARLERGFPSTKPARCDKLGLKPSMRGLGVIARFSFFTKTMPVQCGRHGLEPSMRGSGVENPFCHNQLRLMQRSWASTFYARLERGFPSTKPARCDRLGLKPSMRGLGVIARFSFSTKAMPVQCDDRHGLEPLLRGLSLRWQALAPAIGAKSPSVPRSGIILGKRSQEPSIEYNQFCLRPSVLTLDSSNPTVFVESVVFLG